MLLTRADTISALQTAIDKYTGDTGPGAWSVQPTSDLGDDLVALAYVCEATEMEDKHGCEPWVCWGGHEILDDSGVEAHQEIGPEYGSDVHEVLLLVRVKKEKQ